MPRAKILPGYGREPGRETADCPARQHRHSDRLGWRVDGCRCPSTVAAHERFLAQKRASKARLAQGGPDEARRRREAREAEAARIAALPESERYKEIDECLAPKHHVPGRTGGRWRAYSLGCRCPSTVKAWNRKLENNRAGMKRMRERQRTKDSKYKIARFHLGRADRTDAEAIALGYRTGPVDKHTRALAIKLMLDRAPMMSDKQIAWRLVAGGQGVISERSINRIVGALNARRVRYGQEPYRRLGIQGDEAHHEIYRRRS